MLKKVDPTKTKAWRNLSEHFAKVKNVHMKDLFAEDPLRFERFSRRFNDILVDYSKNRITPEPIKPLLSLAEEMDLRDASAHEGEKPGRGDPRNEARGEKGGRYPEAMALPGI